MFKNFKQVFGVLFFFSLLTYYLNWKVALVLTGAIVFHECGHLWMAKKLGYTTGGMYLLPFIGGVSFVGHARSYKDSILVSLMGPLAGLALAFVVSLAGSYFHNPVLTAAGFTMVVFNAFNLLPLSVLDGGAIFEGFLISFNKKLGIVLIFIFSGTLLAFILKHISPFLFGLLTFYTIIYLMKMGKEFNKEEFSKERLKFGQTFFCLILLLMTLFLMTASFKLSFNINLGFSDQFLPLVRK